MKNNQSAVNKNKGKKWKTLAIVLGCILFVWAVLAIVPGIPCTQGENVFLIEKNSRPLLIAHGGGNREFPDNTLEACYNAYSVDNNVMLEMDCSITKDGVVIMSHDTTLDYRTNASGNISDWTYADLLSQKVNFGYVNKKVDGVVTEQIKFKNGEDVEVLPTDVVYPDGITARDEEVYLVTTFEQLLKAFPNNPVNIEIKQSGETGLKSLAEVERLIEKYNAYDRVVVASFHSDIYKQMKTDYKALLKQGKKLQLSPEYVGAALMLVGSWVALDTFYAQPVTVMQVPMEQFGLKIDTKAFIRASHRHNVAVHYWTIDNEDDMRHLIEIGADGIMSNYPHMLKKVYDEMFK